MDSELGYIVLQVAVGQAFSSYVEERYDSEV